MASRHCARARHPGFNKFFERTGNYLRGAPGRHLVSSVVFSVSVVFLVFGVVFGWLWFFGHVLWGFEISQLNHFLGVYFVDPTFDFENTLLKGLTSPMTSTFANHRMKCLISYLISSHETMINIS